MILIRDTGFARISAEDRNGFLVSLKIGVTDPCSAKKGTPLLENLFAELEEYFSGNRKQFNIPLAPEGTEFRHAVWQTLTQIPYGQVISYGELAKRAGSPGAARAVGSAMHCNPIPILIPCHRVVASHGIGGYGYGLAMKRKLFAIEQIHGYEEKA